VPAKTLPGVSANQLQPLAPPSRTKRNYPNGGGRLMAGAMRSEWATQNFPSKHPPWLHSGVFQNWINAARQLGQIVAGHARVKMMFQVIGQF
jgi:hypothetical protein